MAAGRKKWKLLQITTRLRGCEAKVPDAAQSFALELFASRYESATDAGLSLQWEAMPTAGVPRRELLYQPPQAKWVTPSHTPHTLTPRTLTPPLDQPLTEVEAEAEGEGDSGFQEAGLAFPPLVSPQRAKEALMLGSGKQLVPMVGPQQTPVSEELSATYMDKARQASEYNVRYSIQAT